MSVHSLVSSVSYTSGQVFPFNFLVYEADHLQVTLVDAAEVPHLLLIDIDYTIPLTAFGTESGGSVTLIAGPLAVGERIILDRIVPHVQELDLRATGAFLPESIEQALDLLTMMIQGHDVNLARALLLGVEDIDGQGAFEGRSNRIEDIADPIAGRDVVNLQTLEAWAQGAALGVPTIVPPIWEHTSPGGTGTFQIPGATLSNKNTYTMTVDGVAQLRSAITINMLAVPPVLVLDDNVPAGMKVEIQCIGYARPIDPIPIYVAGARPVASLAIQGMVIRWRPTSMDLGPTLVQICDLNSAGDAEWATLTVTT